MAFDKLPEEILVHILSFLSRSDLLESALTCRRWAQAVAAPPLLRNVWLVIRNMKKAGTIFANTRRQYENLRLDTGPLRDFDAAFWTNVGPSLRKLEIIQCGCEPRVFYSILQACSSLDFIEIRIDHERIRLSKPELPSGMNARSIEESMRNLYHLHLDLHAPRMDTLEYLLISMPMLSSVGLSLFKLESDFLSRLTKILGTSRRITTLELDSGSANGEELEEILRTFSSSLRKLKFRAEIPTRQVFEALKYCTKLRDVNIQSSWFDTRLFTKILSHAPELECLAISSRWQSPLLGEDLIPLFDLKKLRKLHLDVKLESDSHGCILQPILREIARMISLESLTLQKGAVNRTGFRILASLPKLRNLKLKLLQWGAESFRMILFDFKKHRKLADRGDGTPDRRNFSPFEDSEVDPESLALVKRIRADRRKELEFSLGVLELEDVTPMFHAPAFLIHLLILLD